MHYCVRTSRVKKDIPDEPSISRWRQATAEGRCDRSGGLGIYHEGKTRTDSQARGIRHGLYYQERPL